MLYPPMLDHKPIMIRAGLAHATECSHWGPWMPTAAKPALIRPVSGFSRICQIMYVATPLVTEGRKNTVTNRGTPFILRLRRLAMNSEPTIAKGMPTIRITVLPRYCQKYTSLACQLASRCWWNPRACQKLESLTNFADPEKLDAPCRGAHLKKARTSAATTGNSVNTAKPATLGRMNSSALNASSWRSLL